MSHEFEVHHLVSQLVALLKVQDVGSVDSHVELLLKNRTPYVTTQVNHDIYAWQSLSCSTVLSSLATAH